MKAAILKAFGSPLAIETMPDPVLGTGEIIVDASSGNPSYAMEIVAAPGKLRYRYTWAEAAAAGAGSSPGSAELAGARGSGSAAPATS